MALRVAVLVYVGFGAVLLVFQSRFLYRPSRELESTPEQLGLAHEDVWFRAADGVKLFGWFVPAAKPRAVVLFFHGNGGNISHRLWAVQMLHKLNLSTFIFDYRGYGQSEGKPGEEGIRLDAEAARRWLVNERGVPPGEIVLFGRSLGGAVAARLAADHTPAALMVESTFTSFPDLAADQCPWYPARLMARFDYNTLDCIARLTCPVLVAHSRGDDLIPFHHGRRLFEAAAEPKEFLRLEGGHNDTFEPEGRYEEVLSRFIAAHVGR